ncbi:hypothetical protein DL96DRAFT_1651847 [Flagelloscypha sp. PMI_526]|nr:hypothetical protein DL96DRAFT_1651847 [Flagelloscypha sp. PMI_526]
MTPFLFLCYPDRSRNRLAKGFSGGIYSSICYLIIIFLSKCSTPYQTGVRMFVEVIVILICAEHFYWGSKDTAENVARHCIGQRLDAILASDFRPLISETNSPNDKSELVFNIVLQNLLPRPTQN